MELKHQLEDVREQLRQRDGQLRQMKQQLTNVQGQLREREMNSLERGHRS